MESDIDHIHFLIRYIPRLSIAQIVRGLKQESTRQIWLLHPTTLQNNIGISIYFGLMAASFAQSVRHLLILFVSIFLIRVSRLHPIHAKSDEWVLRSVL